MNIRELLLILMLTAEYAAPALALAGIKPVGRIYANPDVLEQHLEQDDRLLSANYNLHFIEAMNNERVVEEDLLTFPDVFSGRLVLEDKYVFIVTVLPLAPLHEEMNRAKPQIGINKRFDFVSQSTDEKRFSLEVNEYFAVEGYYAARNDFLDATRGSTMTFIPFEPGPANLGTAAVASNLPDVREVWWLDHNLFFTSLAIGLSEQEQQALLNWVQQRVVKVNSDE